MPQHASTLDLLQRLAVLEEQVAKLQRSGTQRDELPFYPIGFQGMPYADATSFTTVWDTIMAPRTGSLAIALRAVGDQVAAVNTGGSWQILADADVVGSGLVPATFTIQTATVLIDLAPYLAQSALRVQIQVRRTAGATTGGKFGGGGAIGLSPTSARMI